MALALCRIGLGACALDPHEMGLDAEGDPLDSDLRASTLTPVLDRFADNEVVVVPGFTAGHADHGVVTLGRGGTDLSAVFFAARLDSKRVRLLKDVDGVYAEDPAKNPAPSATARSSYEAAAEASAGLIQPKAIHAAALEDIVVEVAAIGHHEATVIAAGPARKEVPVVLAAAAGRLARLRRGRRRRALLSQQRPDLFKVNPVLVRHPDAPRQRRRRGLHREASTRRSAASPIWSSNCSAAATSGRPDACVAAPRGACRDRQQGGGGAPL